ncbi:MAG TPA: DedA family protein [Candidatus Aquilonibacter sp.]
MEHVTQIALSLIDHYGYGGLFVVLTLGNFGAPVGAELVVPAAGALTATGHLPFLWLTIVVCVLGELAGATIGYAIGRFGGRPLIDKYGPYIHLSHANLDRVHGFFERYGSFAVFICRFIPFLRGIVSIPAGLAEMNLAQFYFWYALGSTIFCGALVWLGVALGHHLDDVLPLVHKTGLILLIVAVLVIAGVWFAVWQRRQRAPRSI